MNDFERKEEKGGEWWGKGGIIGDIGYGRLIHGMA
jgi:hypothetical protein